MAINPNIPLSVNPVQLPDQLGNMGRAMSIKSMMGNQRIQGLQANALEQNNSDRITMREALAQAGGDFTKAGDLLASQGLHGPANELRMAGAAQTKSGIDNQTSQLNLDEKQTDMMARIAAGMLNSSPEDQAALYPQAVAAWKQYNLPNSDKFPEQWDAQKMVPALKQILQMAQTSKDALEQNAFAASRRPAQTSAQESAQADGPQIMAATAPLQFEGEGSNLSLPGTKEQVLPEVNITAKPPAETVESLREKARNAETIDVAKFYEEKADKLDARLIAMEKRDATVLKPVSGAPGILFNEKTGKYSQDGVDVPAATVQKIADRNKKAGANSVNIGDSALGLGTKAQGDVDKTLLETTELKRNLRAIKRKYRPEYTQFADRANMAKLGLMERAGQKISESDRAKMTGFYQWKQDSLAALNAYIKAITGAALSEQEAIRIRAAFPDPGEGIFDGDGATQFEAKLNSSIKQAKMAEARAVYIKRNGMSMGSVPLESMPRIINERGAVLEKSLAKEGLKGAELEREVRMLLADEFGLVE